MLTYTKQAGVTWNKNVRRIEPQNFRSSTNCSPFMDTFICRRHQFLKCIIWVLFVFRLQLCLRKMRNNLMHSQLCHAINIVTLLHFWVYIYVEMASKGMMLLLVDIITRIVRKKVVCNIVWSKRTSISISKFLLRWVIFQFPIYAIMLLRST